jgi:DnaJ-domain-containing protein 1
VLLRLPTNQKKHHTVCLAQVMEAREEVEAASDKDTLLVLQGANQARQADVCAALSAAFGAHDVERAQALVTQLAYWVRLEEAVTAKL